MKSILTSLLQEDDVFIQPDDDAPARKLWSAPKNWLTIKRLLHTHTRVIQEIEEHIRSVLGDQPPQLLDSHGPVRSNLTIKGGAAADTAHRSSHNQGDSEDASSDSSSPYIPGVLSLKNKLKELNRCSNLVQDELIKPTGNLLDMVCA